MPALYKLYDFTKGGTDIVDQKISFFSCKPNPRRLPIVAFSFFLDTCPINASTVLALDQGKDPRKQDSYDFGFDLVMELVRPFIEIRSRNGLSSDITRKIKLVLGESAFPPSIAISLPPFPPSFSSHV